MKHNERVYVSSVLFNTVRPYIIRLTHAAWERFKVLPKWQVALNFVVLYFAVGFIIEGVAGALPSMIMQFLPIPPQAGSILGIVFFLFWPVVEWEVFGEVEHTMLSLSLLFVAATYMCHLRHETSLARVALAQSDSAALTFSRHDVSAVVLDAAGSTEEAYLQPAEPATRAALHVVEG